MCSNNEQRKGEWENECMIDWLIVKQNQFYRQDFDRQIEILTDRVLAQLVCVISDNLIINKCQRFFVALLLSLSRSCFAGNDNE